MEVHPSPDTARVTRRGKEFMKTAESLERQWSDLKRLWRDETARSFETECISQIIACMREVDRERERFESLVEQEQRRAG